MDRTTEIGALAGKTLVGVQGLEKDSERVSFSASDGSSVTMQHEQDCCESVRVEDVCGDVSDLIGSPILLAEQVNSEPPADYVYPEDSHTWAFYKLATIKGSVTIRWLGTSNGYYSESVSIVETNGTKAEGRG